MNTFNVIFTMLYFLICVRILLESLELRIVWMFLKFQNRTKILLFENKQFSSLFALKHCKLNGDSFFPCNKQISILCHLCLLRISNRKRIRC